MSKATLSQKAMRTVYVGVTSEGSYCGHQHLTPTKARNCVGGPDGTQGTVKRLTVKARLQRAAL